MINTFFTPGPSQNYKTLKKHVMNALNENVASISHRGKKFQDIFLETTNQLRELLDIPKEYHIFFLSSATEAMEKIIENCVEKHSYHFINGAFAKKFFDIAVELKKEPHKYEVDLGTSFYFNNIKIPKNVELICFTQNETSTGTMIEMKNIYQIKKQYPEKLIALDIVSSAPHVDVNYKKIDCTFFSVQKCFGLPAGLGVLIVSPRAIKKSDYLQKNGINIGSYHNFNNLLKYANKNQTVETPNVLLIYLLGKITADIKKIGIKKIREQTEEKAELLYSFFEQNSAFELFVKNKKDRSKTIIVVKTKTNSKSVIKKMEKQNLLIGKGYGQLENKYIRIANFPTHSLNDVKKLLKELNKKDN